MLAIDPMAPSTTMNVEVTMYITSPRRISREAIHTPPFRTRGERGNRLLTAAVYKGVGYNTPLKLDADSNSTTILYTMLPKKSNIWKRKGETVRPRLCHIKTYCHNYCISTSSHNRQVHKFPPALFLQPSSSWSVA